MLTSGKGTATADAVAELVIKQSVDKNCHATHKLLVWGYVTALTESNVYSVELEAL